MFDAAMSLVGSAPDPISIDEFRSRQSRLLSQIGNDEIVILCSSPETIHSNDVHHPYRSQSDMIYLTGWYEPESVMLAEYIDSEWIITLFVQPKDTLKEIWEGRRPGVEGALSKWAVDSAYSIDELSDKLGEAINNCSKVYHQMGVRTDIDSIVSDAIQLRGRARQMNGTGPVGVEDPSSKIAELRLRKSSAEIEQMRHACFVSSIAHEAAMRSSMSGRTENQIQAIIEGFFVFAGTSGWAYPSIVGCGENATILHYKENDSVCGDDEIILIDAGSEFRGYASDITRSWPISGKFTEPQRELYQLVLDSQEAAIAECRVGNPFNAPHEAAKRVLAEGLIKLGVITQSLEDSLDHDNGQLRDWYMHNTSHWIGLDVHDVGIYKPNGEPRLFESGMCLTVEPGLYFGSWRPDVDCPERYSNIGIRIEDDVLITDNGPEVLTSACPKTIADIESIVGKSF
ncbi:MAG: M24 family metallopeptidase [Euryarchaeota archaeon]|jgi:Xaa-Pro aminopeptidase|nr:M24 family metallopeptidase [Euryarchaeota archaeon]MBT4924950.1 M24 family metallopeptidase [Euryarchaeota archaeon]MBT5736726.1 M24 family metallopeptidase [Euryarchaeota archaeon]MBT7460818.1 M24 family metallopeptidase [Euryarchaeota archaeon]